MKIERIIAINFGALSERDIELGQANLVVGKNGAGKSTLQDLIQIVLAGNDGSLINLNPAQYSEHRKQKRRTTKRSLTSYAVNMTDDGPGRPNGALCVIGLVFQPDENEEAEPLTALWMAEVLPDQPGLTRRPSFRMKAEYGALVRASLNSLDLLQVDESDGWRVPTLERMSDQFMALHPRGKVKTQIGKKAYVPLLHEWMTSGSMDSEKEAERATKTFIQSIALKDISDVDAIVRDRVLDDMDLSSDVQQTADTLRELELLQAEAERLALMNLILERAEVIGHARVLVPSGILFVENLDAFDAVCAGDVPTPESWWILYAAGFKGSSQRLLNAGGVRWFTEAGTEQLPPSVLQQGLELAANGECEVAFWGDLDFAGMAILREIRRIIPSATAWAPGYERLVALLQGGHGHDPAESTKSGQQDPQVTGCPFSDKVLLPAMRDLRGFVDQEAVCHSDDWAQLTDRGNVANS